MATLSFMVLNEDENEYERIYSPNEQSAIDDFIHFYGIDYECTLMVAPSAAFSVYHTERIAVSVERTKAIKGAP